MLSSVVHLSNDELLARVKQLAGREREFTASLIAHLTELDERRLYLAEGYSSLFTYCTQELRLSEHAAYGRIEAARLIRKFPVLLEMLEHGSVNLTTVVSSPGILLPRITKKSSNKLGTRASERLRNSSPGCTLSRLFHPLSEDSRLRATSLYRHSLIPISGPLFRRQI